MEETASVSCAELEVCYFKEQHKFFVEKADSDAQCWHKKTQQSL